MGSISVSRAGVGARRATAIIRGTICGATLLACAAHPAAVPVVSEPGGGTALAGEWSGEYASPASGRSGSIVFRLSPGADSAFGDVVMIPRGSAEPLHPAAAPTVAARTRRTPQVLTISFVRLSRDSVSGRLEPYHEPECDCTLTTVFTGAVHGDTIEGTFTTTGPPRTTSPRTGTWRVMRRR